MTSQILQIQQICLQIQPNGGPAGNISFKTCLGSPEISRFPMISCPCCVTRRLFSGAKLHSSCLAEDKKSSELSKSGNPKQVLSEGDSFRITKSGTQLINITLEDFVTPQPENNPSSETKLHALIYKKRPEINWIFHLHDDIVLNNPKNLPITEKYAEFGTPELVDEVEKVLGQENYLVMQNHGIIALGSSFEETIHLIKNTHNASKND